ncbi:MAG: TRAP transporter large permease subunit [Gammaproteobacteria bacterium]|nr:TRAP transporter large permease subunit [Gammaproteobacteria bacterium]NIR83494.1 TRAP transporter large permease subunit [Gammaproteobacteria bacterium]NIR91416.1 TRAP transporter large permease subunit [Gammaproteobacteria bacterium]NIU04656.1 TRAP transporter large permease subunit [Gammaproteobacteria bacterium]NIV51698.1 TRAP transporter large permease subunit [Gammaproteobacteria bacterium]
MEWQWALVLMLGLLCGLMALGLPVAFAFFSVNIVGAVVFLGGEAGLSQLARNSMASLASFTLVPIPLFLLMGEILFQTGAAFKAIEAVDRLIARVPGRLSIVSVLGGTVFSSLSGSTIANTAVLGSVLLPDMLRRGYHPTIAMGPIMAVGSIAMLIPPSALAVLLGSLAGISIAGLLIAGIVPGLIMSVVFLSYVIGRCAMHPHIAPSYEGETLSLRARWTPFLIYVVPLLGIFVVVVGSILAGYATPTESAALGCVASTIAAACYRALTWQSLLRALRETAKISVMILFIIVASVTFSQILAFSGATNGLLAVIEAVNASPMTMLLMMLGILLFLGAFMDQVSMIMVTLPFFIPMAALFDINLLWFGVLMLIVMEVSFTTPPFGLLVYVMKGVAPPEITLGQIYAAAAPFIVLEVAVLAFIIAFPELATWLPQQIRR